MKINQDTLKEAPYFTDCYITLEDGKVDAWDNNSGAPIEISDDDKEAIKELAANTEIGEIEKENRWHEIEHHYDLKLSDVDYDGDDLIAPLLDDDGNRQALAYFESIDFDGALENYYGDYIIDHIESDN